jgi:antitoxin ParD1/3/4
MGTMKSSDHVRELIRHDQDRLKLRGLLLAGAESLPVKQADAVYFKDLRNQIRKAVRTRSRS